MGYKGVLGHEFVGVVEEINDEDKSLLGKRVVAEISYGCNDPECEWCAKKNYRHCPNRHTLGIWRKDGCFAEYMTMPLNVLFEVPENVALQEVPGGVAQALAVGKAQNRGVDGGIQVEDQKDHNKGDAEQVAILCIAKAVFFCVFHGSCAPRNGFCSADRIGKKDRKTDLLFLSGTRIWPLSFKKGG